MDFAIDWKEKVGIRIPFICAANDKRAGGDWETLERRRRMASEGFDWNWCRDVMVEREEARRERGRDGLIAGII